MQGTRGDRNCRVHTVPPLQFTVVMGRSFLEVRDTGPIFYVSSLLPLRLLKLNISKSVSLVAIRLTVQIAG
jgi:hypothetical protein